MKLLLVEDEEILADNLKTILQEKGYTVEFVTDGQEAMLYIEENYQLLDLIILDVSLPGLSGIEICRKMRKNNIKTPVLMLTARGTVHDKVTGLEYGADDYMAKPFSVKELLARIHALLRRPQQIISKKIHIGNIEIWVDNRKVFANRNELKLTLKEYELLQFFAMHPNQVIDREQVVDKLWDMNYNSFSNIIDVHIANLRRKLKTAGSNKLIETVHGVGYRLTAK